MFTNGKCLPDTTCFFFVILVILINSWAIYFIDFKLLGINSQMYAITRIYRELVK